MSSPLFAIAEKLLKLQAKYPQEPIVERSMLHARSRHEFAGAYLALWEREGRKPMVGSGLPVSALLRDGIALAEEVVKGIGQIEPVSGRVVISPEFKEICKVFDRLTVSVYGDNYCEVEPSKEARRQAREWREKNGLVSVKGKVLRKREVCQQFDMRYPRHW